MIVCCLYALIPPAKSVFVRDQIAFPAITAARSHVRRYVVRPRACFNLISFCIYIFSGNSTCVPTWKENRIALNAQWICLWCNYVCCSAKQPNTKETTAAAVKNMNRRKGICVLNIHQTKRTHGRLHAQHRPARYGFIVYTIHLKKVQNEYNARDTTYGPPDQRNAGRREWWRKTYSRFACANHFQQSARISASGFRFWRVENKKWLKFYRIVILIHISRLALFALLWCHLMRFGTTQKKARVFQPGLA